MSRRIIVICLAALTAVVAAMFVQRLLPKKTIVAAPPATRAMPSVSVLVAAHDIDAGAVLSDGDFRWQAWPSGSLNPAYIRDDMRRNAMHDFSGRIARVAMIKDEPVLEQKVSKQAASGGYLANAIPENMTAVSIAVTPDDNVGGFVQPGDKVDVILISPEKINGVDSYTSDVVLSNVTIAAVDDKTSGNVNSHTMPGKSVTFVLTLAQADALLGARRLGTLSLILHSASFDTDKAQAPSCDARIGRRDSVRIFRAGLLQNAVIPTPQC